MRSERDFVTVISDQMMEQLYRSVMAELLSPPMNETTETILGRLDRGRARIEQIRSDLLRRGDGER